MRTLRIDRGTPSTLPVTLDFVKDHSRILDTQFDPLLFDAYIPSAVDWAETFMKRAIVSRTVTWVMDDFPRSIDEGILLPLGKTQSVSSIVYTSNNSTTTLTGPTSGSPAGTDYREDLTGDDGGVLYPAYNGTWPEVDINTPQPIVITFSAGWTAAQIPEQIKHAILMYCEDAVSVVGGMDAVKADLKVKETLISGWRLIRC